MEAQTNSWDCLGGVAVVRAAGLKTSDFLQDNGLKVGNRLIAGNDEVYAERQAIFG
jgi:myo-inositol-1(or 4)-monophosphatase